MWYSCGGHELNKTKSWSPCTRPASRPCYIQAHPPHPILAFLGFSAALAPKLPPTEKNERKKKSKKKTKKKNEKKKTKEKKTKKKNEKKETKKKKKRKKKAIKKKRMEKKNEKKKKGWEGREGAANPRPETTQKTEKKRAPKKD